MAGFRKFIDRSFVGKLCRFRQGSQILVLLDSSCEGNGSRQRAHVRSLVSAVLVWNLCKTLKVCYLEFVVHLEEERSLVFATYLA